MHVNNRNISKFKNYVPLFFLICFSGNPLFTAQGYSKILLIFYTIVFSFYMFKIVKIKLKPSDIFRFIMVIIFVIVVTMFQLDNLGFVSYPGVFALILKIYLGFLTVYFYRFREISFLDSYISIISILGIISLPFFFFNMFVHSGIQLSNPIVKSYIFYTSYPPEVYGKIRNAGMFWEPGAHAGYLLLALLFIVIKNKKYRMGDYKKEVFCISIALLTSQSTTGYLVLGVIIVFSSLQEFKWKQIILFPTALIIILFSYNKLEFLQPKIENQYEDASNLVPGEYSNTRYGSLIMDSFYIQKQPLIGNGLNSRTRLRYNPTLDNDIGNGNGMSDFMACWGIPFFLYWTFCFYYFTKNLSNSIILSISILIIIILLLQGEQFLNFPIFLLFFVISSEF